MNLFHPSKKKLEAWLDDPEDDKINDHVSTCDKCSSVLELLDTKDDPVLRTALAEALDPEVDFLNRLEDDIGSKIESKQFMHVFSDIFMAGIETSRILVLEESSKDE